MWKKESKLTKIFTKTYRNISSIVEAIGFSKGTKQEVFLGSSFIGGGSFNRTFDIRGDVNNGILNLKTHFKESKYKKTLVEGKTLHDVTYYAKGSWVTVLCWRSSNTVQAQQPVFFPEVVYGTKFTVNGVEQGNSVVQRIFLPFKVGWINMSCSLCILSIMCKKGDKIVVKKGGDAISIFDLVDEGENIPNEIQVNVFEEN